MKGPLGFIVSARRRGAMALLTERGGGLFLLLGLALLLAVCTSRVESSTNTRASSPQAAEENSPTASEQDSGLAVRILSFNVRWDGFPDGSNSWPHRRALVGQVLRDSLADSVGLQEPSERQVADLVDIDPAYEAFTYEQTTQPILFRRERFRLADGGGFLLFEGNWRPGSRRTCTWVRLEERSTGRAYYHFNVHLDHRSARSRSSSARRLVAGIMRREHPDPFVVTGDFNADEESAVMAYLLRGQPLRDENGVPARSPLALLDTFRIVHPDATEVGTFGAFAGKRNGVKIDFVLVESGTVVNEAKIIRTELDGQYPSDHYPVSAVARFARSSPGAAPPDAASGAEVGR